MAAVRLPLAFDPARHESQLARDARVVLLGWSDLPGSAEATNDELDAMPRERFDAAVAHLAAQGFIVTSYYGTIRGVTAAGRVLAQSRFDASQRALADLDAAIGAA